jgi:hypothetical protein
VRAIGLRDELEHPVVAGLGVDQGIGFAIRSRFAPAGAEDLNVSPPLNVMRARPCWSTKTIRLAWSVSVVNVGWIGSGLGIT